MPLLFQACARAGASSWEVVAERSIWSLPCALALVAVTGAFGSVRAVLTDPKTLMWLVFSAALVATNWILYVWAVQNHHTLSAALAYYINPLMSMAAGAALFGERLDRIGIGAIVLAVVGVVFQAVALGEWPWASLAMGGAFCGYGIVRKRVSVDAQTGLLVETALLAVPAAAYAIWLAHSGGGVFGKTSEATWLLLACGPITVFPLAAFAFAARRLSLTLIGFMQFFAPTVQFAIGVAAGEPLTPMRIASFGFIWAGAAVFAWGMVRAARRAA